MAGNDELERLYLFSSPDLKSESCLKPSHDAVPGTPQEPRGMTET